jgi:hypothetical protein
MARTKTYLVAISGVGVEDAAEYQFDDFPEITETDATTQYTGAYTDDESGVKFRQWLTVRNKNLVSTYITEVVPED